MTDHIATGNPAWTYENFFVPVYFRPWAEMLVDQARLQPGERILDLGCGTGVVSRVAWQCLANEVQLTGLDANPMMLEVAREMAARDGARVDFHEGNAAALPFRDSSFDVVLIQQALQFFPDKPAAIGEVRRVLARHGRVAVLAWGDLEHQPFSKVEARAVQKHLGTPAMDVPFSLGNPDDLRDLFLNAGFVDVGVEPHAHDARFPSAETYFETIVVAAAAAMPELRDMSPVERSRLAQAVKNEMAETVEAHSDGEALVYPVEVNILTARKAA